MSIEEIDQELDSISSQQLFLNDCIKGGLMVYHCEYLLGRVNSRREELVEERMQLLFVPSEDLDRLMSYPKEQLKALSIRATS
jgi:hypothetical protein